MPSIDMPLAQLHVYRPDSAEPDDFDHYWEGVLAQAKQGPLNAELRPAGPPMAGTEAYSVTFEGLDGATVTGWYVRPVGEGPFPGIAHYHGYSGRAARPLDLYTMAAQGIAVLSMDCRGQGGGTPDIPPVDGGHHTGWLTRGLADPATYYYRYVFGDGVRALDLLASFPEVDGTRLATTGASQGGALCLAVAALSGRAVFSWADVPFLCDFPRAVELSPEAPYSEVSNFLRSHPALEGPAFRTLAYFDLVNHARRLRCPVKVTVGLWDAVCPPSTIFGMFSQVAAQGSELVVMPYTGHQVLYDVELRRFTELVDRLGARSPA